MEFKELTEDEFRLFIKDNPSSSFMQTPELAHLKEERGSIKHYVGVLENEKIIAGSLLLEDKTILNKRMFYAPRGLIVDYNNYELLKFFTEEVKKYIKKHKGFMLTIDPNVIYRKRSSDGDIIKENGSNDEAIDNLKKLGYKHHGFNLYLDTKQARWCYLLELDEEYEEKKKKFSKSTRKNIESCIKKGLMVREGTIDDLDTMTEIFEITSKRKDFFSRSLEYYQQMYKNMSNLMTIYIAYLDPDIYYEHTLSLLNEAKEKLHDVEEKMKNNMVGTKLIHDKELALKQISKYESELDKATKFKKEYPNGRDIGCLLSLRSGSEYLTLSSGILADYKEFTPKYLMYEHHIKEAYKEGFKYCNFYGITGDFNPKGKYYGIYEFKKGFNGNVIEYIGEFDLKVSLFYNVYRLLKRIKNLIGR